MEEFVVLIICGLTTYTTYYILKKAYNFLVHHSDLVWEQQCCSVCRELKWVLTSDDDTCNRTVTFLISQMSNKWFIGLDLEWDPNYIKGIINRPAIIQLGTHTGHCLLYRLQFCERLPSQLTELLCNPVYLKVGVGIEQDVAILRRFFSVDVRGVMDLRAIAPPAPNMGLASLAQNHLRISLPKEFAFTNWSQEELSLDQQAYAARDAYIGALLAQKLASKVLQMYPGLMDHQAILQVKRMLETKYGVDWWKRNNLNYLNGLLR